MTQKDIAALFVKERKKKGLTQQQIENSTGINQTTISLFEKNGTFILSNVCKYADALGCHLELVPNNKKETQAPSEPQKMTDAELVELNSLRRILSSIKELVK